MDEKIRLWTGYELEQKGAWEKHLALALIHEIFTGSLKRGFSTEDSYRLLIQECDRVAKVHNLKLPALMKRVFIAWEKVFGKENKKNLSLKKTAINPNLDGR